MHNTFDFKRVFFFLKRSDQNSITFFYDQNCFKDLMIKRMKKENEDVSTKE